MRVTAIASVRRWPHWLGRLARGCVAAACLALGLVVAFPQPADALSPALGRWAGGGSGGRIQFVISRVRGTLVLSDVVVSCAAAEGEDPDSGGVDGPGQLASGEAAIGRNGRIDDNIGPGYRQFSDPISGHLNGRSGTVTADATIADESESGGRCPQAGLRDVPVAPSGARAVRDGIYSISGPLLGTGGIFFVYGEGALIENGGDFGTPVGGFEDDPEACAEAVAAATFAVYPFPGPPELPSAILPASDDSFSVQTMEDNVPDFLVEATLDGRFTSATAGVGVYSATSVYEELTCVGAGPFAMTLARPAPALVPAAAPRHHRRRPQPPEEGPSAQDCSKAIKYLTQYNRLFEKVNKKPMPRKQKEELDRKRTAGTISSSDLPAFLQRDFPPKLRGLRLDEVRARCSKVRKS